MRVLFLFLAGIFAVPAANGDNVALSSLGATATTNAYLTYQGVSYIPSNAIDGSLSTEWVAPGGTIGPYLLINLGQLYSVDDIIVNGVGNPGLTTSFNIYVGTSSDISTLESSQPLISVTDQVDGMPWSIGASMVATEIQYLLYLGTQSTSGCPGTCYPGNAYFNDLAVPTGGQDDAFTTGIIVDVVPEPTMFEFLGFSLGVLVLARLIYSEPGLRFPRKFS